MKELTCQKCGDKFILNFDADYDFCLVCQLDLEDPNPEKTNSLVDQEREDRLL